MNKKLVALGLAALAGIGVFLYIMWRQAAPTTRDPDIGAGLVGLIAGAVSIFGVLGFVLTLISSRKHNR